MRIISRGEAIHKYGLTLVNLSNLYLALLAFTYCWDIENNRMDYDSGKIEGNPVKQHVQQYFEWELIT